MPFSFLNSLGDVVDQHLVEVVAAQVRVAVDALDLEHAFADVQDRDVERAAAEVEDGDLLALLLVEAVGQRGGRRLVDDAHALRGLLAGCGVFDLPLGVEAGDLGGLDGRLPLGVVEVGGHGDDRLADGVAQVRLGGLLELAQDHRRDFRRRVGLAVDLDLGRVVGAADDLVGDELLLAGRLPCAAGP